ncbi:PLD phosphodiesterase domain-containing protein [Caenorhabditis elegans]|uniref:PLD phosphodiesterase domain-containing protein n=1 Tax=Caenorhabditis elegans TaxID=6239 RepID=Q1W0R4_CAEEL|nr:PLD phosphodiesterase domain-containing protein [Caenorhabditis elegans]CCD69218.2 PLD phosphodiesterase domain-containing protein [Caenorhabditis elegans]|eukprot:NP_001040758.2 Uncharacterized protein CELE_F10G7.12 [Caenorhabditis elegans]
MISITQDALKLVSEKLSPTSRLNMAAVNQRCFYAATKWHDVKTIVFDNENVTMVGANFVHTFENSSFVRANGNKMVSNAEAKEIVLKLCPAVKKLITIASCTSSSQWPERHRRWSS